MRFDTARTVGREPHGSSDDLALLDFSANTNPETPSGVEDVYRRAFEASRRYPPEPPTGFREAAADYVGCAPREVIPTPGGLAAIRLTISLAVDDGDTVLVPAPSFGEYAREVRLHGGDPVAIPQDRILEGDPDEHSLVVVCNPNNPTGNAYEPTALRSFAARCRESDTPLLVDEAFLGFTDHPSLAGTDGVVVARSLTKLFGLPGIRAGFAVATGAFRDALRGGRRPWNLSAPAIETGAFCMAQTAFVSRTRERVRSERERLRAHLSARFDVHPSDAPFLLIGVGDRDVDDVLDHARDHGIALRDARTFPGLDAHVRVAVRTPTDNDRLLEVLDGV